MIWIDFENKKPTDTFAGWTAWSPDRWQQWLAKSTVLLTEMTAVNDEAEQLNNPGDEKAYAAKISERNKKIDDNRAHWDQLKPWLSAISNGKCWFTEARDIASHMDVEHFRPKKTAKNIDGTERDGYWWLAFDYTNYRLAGNVPNRKKGGWFPLHSDSLCSKCNARCEESETHYLLDPIKQTDAALLAFNEEGNAIPVPGTTNDWELARVEESIKRLKLNEHDALPAARRDVWQEMTRIISRFLEAKRAYRPGINPAPLATMQECARQIHDMTRPQAILSSVALWCIRFKNDPQLLRLIA